MDLEVLNDFFMHLLIRPTLFIPEVELMIAPQIQAAPCMVEAKYYSFIPHMLMSDGSSRKKEIESEGA